MTAAAKDLSVLTRDSGALDIKAYKVADNVKIYKDTLVVVDSSGYARPARNTAGDLVVGLAVQQFDNTITGHAAGGRDALGQWGVRVRSGIHAKLLCTSAATQASVGQAFYALDDQTVGAALGTGNLAGIVTEFVDATHVWVLIATPVAGATVIGGGGQATVAGGGAAVASFGAVGIGIYFGSGAPTISAVKGSLYIRTDGSSTSTRMYINTDGATTWTNFTTAA